MIPVYAPLRKTICHRIQILNCEIEGSKELAANVTPMDVKFYAIVGPLENLLKEDPHQEFWLSVVSGGQIFSGTVLTEKEFFNRGLSGDPTNLLEEMNSAIAAASTTANGDLTFPEATYDFLHLNVTQCGAVVYKQGMPLRFRLDSIAAWSLSAPTP